MNTDGVSALCNHDPSKPSLPPLKLHSLSLSLSLDLHDNQFTTWVQCSRLSTLLCKHNPTIYMILSHNKSSSTHSCKITRVHPPPPPPYSLLSNKNVYSCYRPVDYSIKTPVFLYPKATREAIKCSNSQTQQEEEEMWSREGWEGWYGAEELEAVQGEHKYYGREWQVEEESYPPTPREPCLDVRVNSEEIPSFLPSPFSSTTVLGSNKYDEYLSIDRSIVSDGVN